MYLLCGCFVRDSIPHSNIPTSVTKTASCAVVVVTASAGATTEARDVSTLAFGKGTRNSAGGASAKPELLRQGPPMPGLSFFKACRAAVRKCLVVAPRSVLSCVFSMPTSDGAMTRRCMLWIRRRNRAIALLMGRRGKPAPKDDGEDEEDDEKDKGEAEKKEKEGVQKAL